MMQGLQDEGAVLMDLLSQILLVVMAIAIAMTTFFLGRSILRNMKTGVAFRRALGRRLHGLRMDRMLDHLGVNRGEYLHTRSVLDIEQHLRRCDACVNTEACDDVLDNGTPAKDYDFCDNYPDLLRRNPHSPS